MPGLQERTPQKQSEHKMSPYDRVGRREELLILHTEDSSEEMEGVVSRTGCGLKEILSGNFATCGHKEPLQQFLLCQAAGFLDGL